jgi:hypothetical protein
MGGIQGAEDEAEWGAEVPVSEYLKEGKWKEGLGQLGTRVRRMGRKFGVVKGKEEGAVPGDLEEVQAETQMGQEVGFERGQDVEMREALNGGGRELEEEEEGEEELFGGGDEWEEGGMDTVKGTAVKAVKGFMSKMVGIKTPDEERMERAKMKEKGYRGEEEGEEEEYGGEEEEEEGRFERYEDERHRDEPRSWMGQMMMPSRA